MANYTIVRESNGVALETVTARRVDYAARTVRRFAEETLRGMGKAEAIGGNYGVNASPDSLASHFLSKSRAMADGLSQLPMRPRDYRESTFVHHSRLRDGQAHPARIFIIRES